MIATTLAYLEGKVSEDAHQAEEQRIGLLIDDIVRTRYLGLSSESEAHNALMRLIEQ